MDEIIELLRSIDSRLARLVESSRGMKGDSRESVAIAALLKAGPNLTLIASQVGVSRSTLYRWTSFMDAYNRVQADAEQRKRGRRGDR